LEIYYKISLNGSYNGNQVEAINKRERFGILYLPTTYGRYGRSEMRELSKGK